MRVHRHHPLRRHDDPMPAKAIRSLVWLISALALAFAVFGFLRDAEAGGFTGFSLYDGAGGRDYYSYGRPNQGALWMNLGIRSMQMGAAARMQRYQHAHELQMQRQQHEHELRVQEQWTPEPWTPAKARANWGRE